MLTWFAGLLLAMIGIQVYRGIVAFRNPDRELPSRRTSRLAWTLAILVLVVATLVAFAVGAMMFGHETQRTSPAGLKPGR